MGNAAQRKETSNPTNQNSISEKFEALAEEITLGSIGGIALGAILAVVTHSDVAFALSGALISSSIIVGNEIIKERNNTPAILKKAFNTAAKIVTGVGAVSAVAGLVAVGTVVSGFRTAEDAIVKAKAINPFKYKLVGDCLDKLSNYVKQPEKPEP